MTASTSGGEEQAEEDRVLEPRHQSLLRSSLLMASGTLVSRILGFVRNAMLIAAIGVSLGAADAFGAANTLPNNVYNLLAAGVFDAVLIPQIVRALRRRGGSVYVNRLLTAAGTILFVLTVLAMVGAPLLITITSSGFPPEVRALAIAFAIWCLPQIFFYGVYNLLGEVLNARGIFGPYMWAPVVNNVVSITGLGLFLYLWGPSGEVFEAHDFTSQQMVVLAGSATLGVILQALVLFIPLRKSGVALRLDFRFRQTNFGSASKVAGWTFATLMVSQLGVLSTTNIASLAVRWGVEHDQVIATLPAYNTAFMLYMVPQSLIAVTLATALFTRLANNVADSDYQGIAHNYHTGVRLIVMLSMLAVSIMVVAAVPIMQAIMPHFRPEMASLYAGVLVALVFAIPSTGIILVSQRVFFAFENAKPVFLMGIVPTALQIVVGWSFFFFADGQWWTVGAALGETACRVVQGFIAIFWTAHFVRTINAGRVVADYLLGLVALATSGLAGWAVLHLISPISAADSSSGRFVDSLWRILVVSIVVTIVFFFTLRLVDASGSRAITQFIQAKLPARFRSKKHDIFEPDHEPDLSPDDVLTRQLPLGRLFPTGEDTADEPPEEALAPETTPDKDSGKDEVKYPKTPPLGEIIDSGFAMQSLERPLRNVDPTNTGQIPVLIGLQEEEEDDDGDEADDGAQGGGTSVPPPPPRDDLPGFDEVLSGAAPGATPAPSDGPPPPDEADSAPASPAPFIPSREYDACLHAGPAAAPVETPREADVAPVPQAETADTPGTPPARPAGPKRFDPTAYTLLIAGGFVVVGIIFAFSTLRSPAGPDFSLEDIAGPPAEVTEEETPEESAPAETVAPSIASIEVFSWGDDGKDHPELAAMLTDGDPYSEWYTRYYDYNSFTDDDMISLLITLNQEAVVRSITLDVTGAGGEIAVRAAEPGNPRVGEVLTVVPIEGETVITLPEPTALTNIGLNFVTLPMDDEGLYRAKVTGISVQ